ncbi:type I secretion system permease/ATPase [Caenimonas koreensis]|uniref:Type I secretion system permease/ATPase n=1 Tax=Caenimonas koreensis DSM 17982 TaxID=1121255 RepID=A0A844B1U4_9BURK|nr:type I secretion system permease/ATPase [Caenimonas koreensis]MRD47242.1 type I secretion system permease/ATPase [Caenimonas koreensis DSM 17982]
MTPATTTSTATSAAAAAAARSLQKAASKSELAEAVASLRPYFKRAMMFSLVSALLVLAPTAYMLEVYDRVVTTRNHFTLAMLLGLVLGAYIVMEILEWARAQVMYGAGVALDAKLGDRVFNAMFTANLRRLPGGTQQTMNDFRTIRDFLYSPLVMAVMESPVSLVFTILVFAISPILGCVALAGAFVQVGIGVLNERATKPPLIAANRSSFAAQQYADGVLRNAQVIESMGMQRDIHKRWIEKQREFLGLQAVASERAGGYQAVTKFLQQTVSSGLMGVAALLLLHDMINGGSGMLIIASVLGGRILAPFVIIVGQWRGFIAARDSWTRVDALLTALPAKPEAMTLPAPKGSLQVESIVAAAPGSPLPILKGVAFGLLPGDVLAVIGPSASGKTTLARCLVGLWPSSGGKVRLDGVDVFAWDKSELGPHVGYLPQDVELFEGTMAENIARFGEVEMAKVQAAASAVGLHEFILALPQGYDSPVGRDGARLSGGQRQRVGLARALYGDPVFVVLDEPNSSLDDEGDAALASAIKELKGRGTTFVVITHRTSILGVVDKLLVLKDGQVQGFGPRDDVLAAMAKAAQQAQQAQQQRQQGGGAPRLMTTP